MALATIGETVVSKIIVLIVQKASFFIGQKLLPAGDTEAEIRRLEDALPQIKAVLEAVESNQIKTSSKALNEWLWQFRDAIEAADDVLDELAYYDLKEKVQAQNNQASSSLWWRNKKKIVNYVRGKYKMDALTRLVEAVKGLDKVVVGVNNFLNLEKHFQGKKYEDVKQNDDRETGSLLTESVVFGRDKERDMIVKWLTTDPVSGENGTDNTGSLSAFTILGIGGLGKTTLAQLICQDEMIRQFFYPIVWVCVSDNFDAVEIITKILEVITNERPIVRSLAPLQKNLKDLLIRKQFLLVLDDVWNDANEPQWKNLVTPLKFGHERSRVLITSRMESVADMVAKVIEGTKNCHKLEGLKEEEFLALFNKHAFAGIDPDEFKNLHPIGKQITEKLGGCPLAAKIIGGVLNYCMEFDYWNRVLKEDMPNFLSGMNDIMVVLRLSYNHLPTHLQVCFRYCSIFPKNFHFENDELIKMWMGSRLIEPRHKRERPEDVGNEYFNHLVRKSFFDLKFKGFRSSEQYYVMHDLLHDLAMSISEGECLRIEKDLRDVPKTMRHLQLQIKNVHAMQEITHLKSLRTLFITFEYSNSDYGDMKILNQILKQFKSLRLLSLTGNNFPTAPDAIGELIHLRYLLFSHCAPSGEQVPWFPPSICRLYHLEVIKFSNCAFQCFDGIDKYGISNLINLRYLDIPSYLCQIPEIGKLSCLQELDRFHVGVGSGYQINELGSLRNLRKMWIMDLENVSSFQQAKEARLSEKEYLKELGLHWYPSHVFSEEYCEHLLDNLRPHVNLKVLQISAYGGARPPVWMDPLNLVNLTSLLLYNCSRLSILPALGCLPLLKHLTLRSLPKIKKVDHTFYGNDEGHFFPVLKELIFEELEEWEEWVEVEGVAVFQRLQTLNLQNCPKLRKLPRLPASLRNLDISNAGIDIIPIIYESITNGISTKPSSLSFLRVRNCNHLISLGECLLQQEEHTQAVTNLGSFIKLNSLRELRISQCPKLLIPSGTQQNLLQSSLQDLYIENCGLETPMLESLRNLTLLKKLCLIKCPKLTCLPSADVLSALTSLSYLDITMCKELVSLGGLDSLTSLRHLTIEDCDKLVALSSSQPLLQTNVNPSINACSSSLRLEILSIAHPSLLRLEPLRNLEFTKKLVLFTSGNFLPEEWLLQNRNSLHSLIIKDASNLKHLPASIERMHVLKRMYISGARFRSLPDFPFSLRHLSLQGCHPLLMQRYKDASGHIQI